MDCAQNCKGQIFCGTHYTRIKWCPVDVHQTLFIGMEVNLVTKEKWYNHMDTDPVLDGVRFVSHDL
jgi:hypothetical protein